MNKLLLKDNKTKKKDNKFKLKNININNIIKIIIKIKIIIVMTTKVNDHFLYLFNQLIIINLSKFKINMLKIEIFAYHMLFYSIYIHAR